MSHPFITVTKALATTGSSDQLLVTVGLLFIAVGGMGLIAGRKHS